MTASPDPRPPEGLEAVSEQRQHELIKAYDQESNFRRLAGQVQPQGPGIEVVDSAIPEWTSNFTLDFKRGNFDASWTLRHISELREECGRAVGFPVCSNPATGTNVLEATTYNDMQLGYRFEQLRAMLGDILHGCLLPGGPAFGPIGNGRGYRLFQQVLIAQVPGGHGAALDEVIGPDMVWMLGSKPDARSVIQPEPAFLRLFGWNLQPLLPQGIEHRLEVGQGVHAAHVHGHCHASLQLGWTLHFQVDQTAQQLRGEVVHTEVARVFQRIERHGFA